MMNDCVGGARASDKTTDAYYKFQCDPCAFSGLVKEAITYCKQCQEYMCVTCASAHNGLKLTRSHTMVSGSELASTEQSVAASGSTCPVSTEQSVAASRCTHPESTGQSVAASRSTRPESTGPSDVDHPVATSRSACTESGRKSWLDVKVVSSTAINVSSKDFTGSAVMPDGRVILADWQNKQVILLDQDCTVQSTLTLEGNPWDVAVYGDHAAVVTMPYREQLQYILVDTTLWAGHTIQTGLPCWGMAIHGGEVYVGVSGGLYGNHVQVMDTCGKVTRRNGTDLHGAGRRYIFPGYITVGTGGAVYMSDYDSGHIACYTSSGDVVYDVKHEGMSGPHGMLVDKDGNLLVCCSMSNTIRVLGKDGANHRVIMSYADGVVGPRSMSYRRSDQTLIVTMCNIPSVLAYKLT